MKLVLIVPTKDRPKDLRNLFQSIAKQSRQPDLVIVVDGSTHSIKSTVDDFKNIKTHYMQVLPPSLPKQRNAGIRALPSDVDWIGFLDDDLVLEPGALECMEKFIEENKSQNVKGVGLTILNQPVTKTVIFNGLFLIGNPVGGQVTKSGYASAIPPVTKDIKVDWIYGGATFWDKNVFSQFSYDEWFHGTGYMEDVDFSYAVSRKYQLRICSSAGCYHYHHPITRLKQMSIGEWQFTSWWYFVKKYKDFYMPFVFWGMMGIFIKNILSTFARRSPDAALRALGNLKGALRITRGRAFEPKGFSK